MTYVNITEFAQEFRVTGDWLLQEAEDEFEKGDFVQASEKSWGAAAQHMKALATEHGWRHGTHAHLIVVANSLAGETGNDEIITLFDSAESLHANFYQAHRPEGAVRVGMNNVRKLVDVLAEIPPPAQRPRRTHVRARDFVRTRDGNP